MDGHGDLSLTPKYIIQKIKKLTDAKKLCVGFSGGVDSHVLLDLTVQAFSKLPEYEVSALHVHHGISDLADEWARHCEAICSEYQVPLTVLWVDGNVTGGRSPEEVAREARFSAFENFLEAQQCLLLAHHEADQAETILLRLFRGTGPLGLGGIPEKAPLGKSELIRPLLNIPKEEIIQYARLQNLKWVEDDSNTNTRFDRNFLRTEIMPILEARWPRVVRSMNRAGALCFETATAVQVLALGDLEKVKGSVAGNLSVAKLLQLDTVRRRGVLRCWLQQFGFALPSRDHMERIDREILLAKSGSRPQLKIGSYEIRRQRDELSVNTLR